MPASNLSIVNVATPFSIAAVYFVPFTVIFIFPLAVSLILTTIVALVLASTVTLSIIIVGVALSTVNPLDSVLFTLYLLLPLYSA